MIVRMLIGIFWLGIAVSTSRAQSPRYFISTTFSTDLREFGIVKYYELDTLLRSSDGGQTWTPQRLPDQATPSSVYFLNPDLGFVVGDSGMICRTMDGGDTWLAMPSGTKSKLYSIHFANDKVGYAAGKNGTILKTADGGSTWITQSSEADVNFTFIYFPRPDSGFVIENNGSERQYLHKTTDGGSHWSKLIGRMAINAINCSSGLVCYGAGEPRPSFKNISYSRILKTANGGDTWAEQYFLAGPGAQLSDPIPYMTLVQNLGDQIAFAAGTEHQFLRTLNGGVTWVVMAKTPSDELNSIRFTDANNGRAIGDDGVNYLTHDGGATWTDLSGASINPTRPGSMRDRIDENGNLKYSLDRPGLVSVSIHDAQGKTLFALRNDFQFAGPHKLSLPLHALPNVPLYLDFMADGNRNTLTLPGRH